MKALMGLITALSFPLMVLNMLGGITSGIWLAVLRDWRTLGLGIGFFFVSTLILGFALMPSLLLAAPAAYFAEKGRMLGLVFFGILSSLYSLALITIWCCGVLFLFMRDANTANIVPRLIWSYGVATGPLGYMASKEQDPEEGVAASTVAVFLAELAYLFIMVLVIFSGITLLGALKVFGSFMAAGLVVQISMVVLVQRDRFAREQAFRD
jgi:hypothetical protein